MVSVSERIAQLYKLLSRPDGCSREEYGRIIGEIIPYGFWLADLRTFSKLPGQALKKHGDGAWRLVKSDPME